MFYFIKLFQLNFSKQTEKPQMGRRVLQRHIWGYSVSLCHMKRTPGLYELSNDLVAIVQDHPDFV